MQINKMSPDEWASWKTHSTTIKFFQFLNDTRFQIADSAAAHIAYGAQINPDALQKDSLRCEILHWISELEFSIIEEFYKEEETDDGTNSQ